MRGALVLKRLRTTGLYDVSKLFLYLPKKWGRKESVTNLEVMEIPNCPMLFSAGNHNICGRKRMFHKV